MIALSIAKACPRVLHLLIQHVFEVLVGWLQVMQGRAQQNEEAQAASSNSNSNKDIADVNPSTYC